MADRFVTTRFEVEVEIDGVTFDDEVVSVSATYGLNSIPTASVVIAGGMNMKTNQPSKIHAELDNLRPRSKAKIILYIINGGGQTNKSPFGSHIIFEGYYAGVGHQRSNTNSNYVLHFVHWLDDLNCGSMANGNWYPGVATDYSQAALYLDAANSGTSGSPVPILDITGKIVQQASTDLWGEVLKPTFAKIAGWEHPEQQGCDNDRKNGDDLVEKALERIPGAAPKPGKLPLISLPLIARLNLNKGVSNMLLANHGYNSFWSKLIGELGPSFLFALSPASTFANVIPFFGGLRVQPTVGSAWRVIKLDDYNYSNFNANLTQLIESVNIFYPFQSYSGVAAGQSSGPTLSFCRTLAKFPKNPTDIRGTVLVRELPHWLHNMSPLMLYSMNGLAPEVDTHDPGNGSPTPTGGVTARPPQTITEHKNIVEKYAQHWYQTTVLGQRFGEFSGKFRLDIAPGSMIAIEVPPAPKTTINPLKSGEPPKYLFASVTQVSFHINAEQHAAGTSITVTNLRNAKENEDDTLTAEDPPLYQEKWPGGPLTEQAAGDNVS